MLIFVQRNKRGLQTGSTVIFFLLNWSSSMSYGIIYLKFLGPSVGYVGRYFLQLLDSFTEVRYPLDDSQASGDGVLVPARWQDTLS